MKALVQLTWNDPQSFKVCYRTEALSIICSHHVCMEVWHPTEGEVLESAPDMTKEPKVYNKYAVGVCKENLLVGHIPTYTDSKFVFPFPQS